jgi:hypothetical protein
MICPCTLGPAEPDQGWCSGALVWDIQQGQSDGVALAGCRAVLVVDLPGDFVSGNATARLIIDERASAEQRRELEAIFTGKRGGAFGALTTLVTKWVPTEVVRTEIAKDNSSVTVGALGQLRLQPIRTEDGRQVTLNNAPIMTAFGVTQGGLARGDGSSWTDPQMRRWQSGGHGGISPFTLSA